jgi:FkbM family methyltransferase
MWLLSYMRIRSLKLGSYRISYTNFMEFLVLYIGIFIFQGYKFKSNEKNPFIIDCGSHIGLSILYFKKLYPQSRIIGFEPNPYTFKILEQNIEQNNLKKVELINAAVGGRKAKVDFFINKKNTWSWGDSTVKNWFVKDSFKKVETYSVKLSSYMDKPVDMLKINIEGSETDVLNEIETKLKLVKKLELHFHGEESNPGNDLDKIFGILERNRFDYSIMQLRNYLPPKKVRKEEIDRSDPYFLFIRAKKK